MGEWTRRCPSWNLKATARARSTRSRQFATTQSMPMSEIVVTYRAYTTWCLGKATRKRKIPGNQHWPSNTSGGSSAPFIRSTQKSWQQPHPQMTLQRQLLNLQSRLARSHQQPSKSEAGLKRPVALTSAKKIAERPRKPSGPLQLFPSVPLFNFFFFWFFIRSLQLGQEVFSTKHFRTAFPKRTPRG